MAPTSIPVRGRDGTPVATYRWEPAGQPPRSAVLGGSHLRYLQHRSPRLLLCHPMTGDFLDGYLLSGMPGWAMTGKTKDAAGRSMRSGPESAPAADREEASRPCP
jgi:hypothetical protein